jgi:hypothetical protein
MTIKVLDGHTAHGKWIVVPILDIIIPKPHRLCYPPAWWIASKNGEVFFYKSYSSPQCNANKEILKYFPLCEFKELDVATTPVFLPMTFIPHKCE